MADSTIEWTEVTWNPTTGCSKVSQGCKFCYAEIMSRRLNAMRVPKYSKGFRTAIHVETLIEPYLLSKPSLIFVNSMSDLFHEDFSLEYIKDVFEVMGDNMHHTFQVLTKRSERLLELSKKLKWTNNIWMGVSIENEDVVSRIEHLKKTKAKVKFLSCEPLLGPLPNLKLKGIDWVIVGGESGRRPRPMKPEWASDIQTQCVHNNIPFFFKQWGGTSKKKSGRLLNGELYDEFPI